MMIKKYFFFLLLILLAVKGFTQESKIKAQFQNFPDENIYLHINDNFLLSGETLQYKAYCFIKNTKELSNLSKVGYIELIDKNNKSIIKQKIRLKNGEGFGDVFIDAKITTGTYKLISYTQWMRNKALLFEENLYIVNPFSEALKSKDSLLDATASFNQREITSNLITVKTDKKQYQQREKVYLNFSLKEGIKNGHFSFSVRKVNPFKNPNKTDIITSINSNNKFKNTTDNFFLPELRGELIQGKVIAIKPNLEVNNIKIALSGIGENKLSKNAISNKNGVFYFNLSESSNNEETTLQVLDKNSENYKIEIINKRLVTHFENFPAIKLTENLRKYIQKRSVEVQIENAFNVVKQDQLKPFKQSDIIFKENEFVYVLDDYKRFKTVKDVSVEILNDVWLSKKKEVYYFHVRDNSLDTNSDLETLLLVDGFVVYNHNDFIDFDAKKIKSIAIVKEKYVYGSQLYQGILNVKTFKNDYFNYSKNNYKPKLLRPLELKKYFNQDYTTDKKERIPDNRNQLLWEPNIKDDKGEVSFYTSDITGDFKIEIEGFTNDGRLIRVTKIITVK